jgi:serine/threonine protein phosphatase PrpC
MQQKKRKMQPKPQYALTFGFKGAQGKRPSMEDEHYVNLNCKDLKNQYESCAIFAVYDGHGGVC